MKKNINKQKLLKKGDIVKVYSLQSFNNGGFINGRIGFVNKNQKHFNSPISVIVERKFNGINKIDFNYELYAQQLIFVKKSSKKILRNLNKISLIIQSLLENGEKKENILDKIKIIKTKKRYKLKFEE